MLAAEWLPQTIPVRVLVQTALFRDLPPGETRTPSPSRHRKPRKRQNLLASIAANKHSAGKNMVGLLGFTIF